MILGRAMTRFDDFPFFLPLVPAPLNSSLEVAGDQSFVSLSSTKAIGATAGLVENRRKTSQDLSVGPKNDEYMRREYDF